MDRNRQFISLPYERPALNESERVARANAAEQRKAAAIVRAKRVATEIRHQEEERERHICEKAGEIVADQLQNWKQYFDAELMSARAALEQQIRAAAINLPQQATEDEVEVIALMPNPCLARIEIFGENQMNGEKFVFLIFFFIILKVIWRIVVAVKIEPERNVRINRPLQHLNGQEHPAEASISNQSLDDDSLTMMNVSSDIEGLQNAAGCSNFASSSRHSDHNMELTFMSGELFSVSSETTRLAESFLRARYSANDIPSAGPLQPNISAPEPMLSSLKPKTINKTVD